MRYTCHWQTRAWTSWSLRPRTYWALRSYSDAVECQRCYEMRLDGRNLREAWPDYDAHVAAEHKPSHYPGQLGSEPHWRDFLAALWAATAEIKRVLKPTGSAFINLGDKYAGGGGYSPDSPSNVANRKRAIGSSIRDGRQVEGIREKSLLLLPELYRAGCTGALAALGGPDPGLNLIARAVIVQAKQNSLPESVRDRVRRSHEDWVHLTREPRYYSAVDEIREGYAPVAGGRGANGSKAAGSAPVGFFRSGTPNDGLTGIRPPEHPLGKLPGSVWSLPSEPLIIPDATKRALNLPDHYAAFGTEIVRRMILGWSPPGICTGCGHGRAPVVERGDVVASNGQPLLGGEGTTYGGRATDGNAKRIRTATGYSYPTREATILGYACPCTPSTRHPGTGESSGPRHGDVVLDGNGYVPTFEKGDYPHGNLSARPKVGPWTEYHLSGWKAPPTRPAVILDPFCGTGTTPLVARALGRFGVGLDLSADYLRLARWRVFDSGAAAKAITRTNTERQVSLL